MGRFFKNVLVAILVAAAAIAVWRMWIQPGNLGDVLSTAWSSGIWPVLDAFADLIQKAWHSIFS